MMQSVKSYFAAKDTKFAFAAFLMATYVILTTSAASASTDADWTTTVETIVKSEAGKVTAVMLAVLAVGLGIFAMQWGVRKAIRFFKATTN